MSRAQLFVGRLSKDVRVHDLEDLLSRHGRITRCDIKSGNMMNYAFVDYEDKRDAEDAIRYDDGYELKGSRIVVEWSKGPSSRFRDGGGWGGGGGRRGYSPPRRYGGGGGGGYGRDRRRYSRSRSRSRGDRRRRSYSNDRKRSRSRSRERRRSPSYSKSPRSSRSVSPRQNGKAD